MPAALPVIGGIASAAGAIGGLFGGDEEQQQQQTSNNVSGFAALPPQVQQAYLQQYLPGVLEQYNRGQYQIPSERINEGQPFQSQGLTGLQRYFDQRGIPNAVNPYGVEPLNQIQQNAITGLGQGYNAQNPDQFINPYTAQALNAYSRLAGNPQGNELGHQGIGNELGQYIGAIGGQRGAGGGVAGLQQYMNPYTDQVTNRTLEDLREKFTGGQNGILSQNALSGSLGAFGGSALGTQLAQNQKDVSNQALDFIANQNAGNYGQAQNQRNLEIERALGQRGSETALRNQYLASLGSGGNYAGNQRSQTLQQMLGAGTALREQNQQELGAGINQWQQQANFPQERLGQFAQNLSLFPGSTTGQSMQYAAAQPNTISKIGAYGQGIGDFLKGGAGGLFAQQQQQQPQRVQYGQDLGNAMPWLGR